MERKRMIVKFLKWLLALCQADSPAVVQQQDLPRTDEVPVPQVDHVHIPQPAGRLLVPGKEMQLNGTMYIIAPLNAAAVKLYRDDIKNVFIGGLPDIELVAKLTLASLQRNYPQMTLQKVEEIIDYQNYFEVWESLLNLSGLIAHIVACTGCTPQQAWSEWDIPSMTAQNEYWRLHPPVHLLIAAQLGYKASDQEGDAPLDADDLLEMFPMPG
jgi:hypothetical protein